MPVFRLLRLLFLSTPSARRATPRCLLSGYGFRISIHALREEGDVHNLSPFRFEMDFYPRPPRGGRPFFMMVILALPGISIHALREEGDVKRSGKIDGAILFLSTPSARRATCFQPMPGLLLSNFYPRPPRGGRLTSAFLSRTTSNFYPRPPRGGRRRHDMADIAASGFLSTPSARRATLRLRQSPGVVVISIHALREEGDVSPGNTSSRYTDFYPRPPRGGRRNTAYQRGMTDIFLSTPSARRATSRYTGMRSPVLFLSTPSARRATARLWLMQPSWTNFYPRPPRGGRHHRHRLHRG